MVNRYYDKCYVINLNETEEGVRRWKIIQQHPYLKDKITRFSATYGKTRNKQLYDNKIVTTCASVSSKSSKTKHAMIQLRRNKQLYDNIIVKTHWDYGHWLSSKHTKLIEMSDGEMGVAISHYRLWEMIGKQNNHNNVLILEDDAIQISTDIEERMDDIFKEVPNNWDIILLGFWLHKGDTGYKLSDNIYRVKDFALMHSYIINKKGITKLLQNLPINAPLDTWVSSISNKLFIYRHNFINQSYPPSSRLIEQKPLKTQILHTNKFIKVKNI